LVISPVPFRPVLTHPICHWTAGIFLSVSILVQTILSNTRLDRLKLDEKGHEVVKAPTAIAGRDQLNLAKFGSS
jgi:hypothetical protein